MTQSSELAGLGNEKARASLSPEVAAERQLLGRLRKVVYEMGMDGQLSWVNDHTSRLLGYPVQDLLNDPALFPRLIHPSDQPQVLNSLTNLRNGDQVELDYRIKPADQIATLRDEEGYIWLRNSATSRISPSGEPLSIFGTMDNITDLILRASVDDLTKAFRREVFMDIAQKALVLAQQNNTDVAVLLLDLDGFKPINDTFGHAAGDITLREIANRLRFNVRPGDTVGRLGGDEFGLLLPGANRKSMDVVGPRLLEAISHPINIGGNNAEVRVGASIGVRLTEDGFEDIQTLLKEADAAMYRAKALGRGRVEIHQKPGNK